MTEGTTCYERDEVLCEDQMCLRTGCRLRNKRLSRGSPESERLPFQRRVVEWLMACFSMEICRDGIERNHRFLEEALELVQSLDCTRSEAHQLVDYVFDRPVGEPTQELGGALVTLTALANCHDMDLMQAGETELARVWTKIDKIRAKQAAKPKHSPLPQHVDFAQCQQEWRPIETAPRDGSIILLGNVGSEPRPAYYGMAPRALGAGATKRFPWTFLDETNGLNHSTDDEFGPTHWMPLPAPPAALSDTSTLRPCAGCDGHECDNGCAYLGAVPSERKDG